METLRTDFLVIGSGIAGLSFALRTARALPEKQVLIICKAEAKESNTRYAQGGVAFSIPSAYDDPDQHVADTLQAGDGYCDETIVNMVVKEGALQLRELLKENIHFDKNAAGEFDLAKEGGHSTPRIYHRGDYTGLELERKLLARVRQQHNIRVYEEAQALDLITNIHVGKEKNKNQRCFGAYVLLPQKKQLCAILAPVTLLATGGLGQLFKQTTNSPVATGDGIAMAYRAGARIKNLAFIQFHPTAFYDPSTSRNFLISEALRGFGAVLRNAGAEPFAQRYHLAGDLATRDIVARAIQSELLNTGTDHVYLDCRHIDKRALRKHFPTIVARCASYGIDLSKQMIPVTPSAHYSCGGIHIDKNGLTSVNGLYACGECAETGLHGANRLASNSLLEALVFARRASRHATKKLRTVLPKTAVKTCEWKCCEEPVTPDFTEMMSELKGIMSTSVGVFCTDAGLKKGLGALENLRLRYEQHLGEGAHPQLITLRNALDVARLVLLDCVERKQNAGVFYKLDLAGLLKKQAVLEGENPTLKNLNFVLN